MEKTPTGYLIGDNEIAVLYYIDKDKPNIVNVFQRGEKSEQKYEYAQITDTLKIALNDDIAWYKSEGYNVDILAIYFDYAEIEYLIKRWKECKFL